MSHFDLLAPFYERVIRPPDPRILAELLELPAETTLLDAGGGTGRVAAVLASLVKDIVVSDLSAHMLAEARDTHGLVAVQAHAEHLPFPTGHFGRILVVDALHHFCQAEEAIVELARVLAPGGRMVIEEPNIEEWSVKVLAVAEKLALMRSHILRPDRIRALAAAEGLEAHTIRDGYTAWIVAAKPA